jgi:putative Mg2+ transporter-C (MgtC) family protein
MTPMPPILAWQDVAIRLAVALAAGALLGLNRGESGKAAGLRTTMLV